MCTMSEHLIYNIAVIKHLPGPGSFISIMNISITQVSPQGFQFLLWLLLGAAISVCMVLQVNFPLAWLSCQAPLLYNEPMNYIFPALTSLVSHIKILFFNCNL